MAWDERYRMLGEGELIREGDECLTDSHLGWQPAKHDIGGQAPDPMYIAHRMYRRLKGATPMTTRDDLASRLREPLSQLPGDDDALMERVVSDREEAAAALEAKDAEIGRLRAILADCATAIGNGSVVSPACSLDFLSCIPKEIADNAEMQRTRISDLERQLAQETERCASIFSGKDLWTGEAIAAAIRGGAK